MHMNRNMAIAATVVALVILVGGFLYMRNNKAPQAETADTRNENMTQASATPVTNTESVTESSDSAMTDGVKEFTVTGSAFKFDPATLTVKKGDKVKITFKNNSGGMHDFVIDELNVKSKVIASGAQEVIEFTADKTGTFEYYCSVGNHRQMGMKGNLVVE
jgi:nitrosocyanin